MPSKRRYGVLPETTARTRSQAKGCSGSGQQARAFLVQGVGDAAAGGIAGHGPLVRGLGDPLGELGVEVVDRA